MSEWIAEIDQKLYHFNCAICEHKINREEMKCVDNCGCTCQYQTWWIEEN